MQEINQICQRQQQVISFVSELREGPVHNSDFSITCVINEKGGNEIASAQGWGKKIKKAKEAAARSAYGKL